MRTLYTRDGRPRSAARLQNVLTAEQIQLIVRRETSRADRTARQFSVVLFRMKTSRRWSVSTCRMAKVLLSRVRLTDDVGWFDEQHLCAVLPDTHAAGARIFAARACDEISGRQPRPLSVVYSYPGTLGGGEDARSPSEPHAAADEPADGFTHADTGARMRITNSDADSFATAPSRPHDGASPPGPVRGGGGGGGVNAEFSSPLHPSDRGEGAVTIHAGGGTLAVVSPVAAVPDGLSESSREQLVEYLLDGAKVGLKQAKLRAALKSVASDPDVALEDLFVRPVPSWKRALDLAGATVGVLLLSPALIVAAVAIKLTSPGPVIFRQRRSGLGGVPFTIFKFRTMCVDAEHRQAKLRQINEQDGPAFKLKRDPRVTKVGHLLRKTSIDELPQLFNVLRGEMSLVGPRPLPVAEQSDCEQWQRHRLNVRPGLTCIWQIIGRSTVTFDEWVRMDVAYMRRQSLWQDLSIIVRTIPAVLLRRGAR